MRTTSPHLEDRGSMVFACLACCGEKRFEPSGSRDKILGWLHGGRAAAACIPLLRYLLR